MSACSAFGNIVNNKISRIVQAILVPFLVQCSTTAMAQPLLPQGRSVLLPAPSAPFVFEPEKLSINSRWRIAIHGLRLAPLDPTVWGIVKRDKTDNRRLVPIRPYFLRASEEQGFRLREVRIQFSFRKVDAHYMLKVPHLKDSLLEIHFNGEYQPAEDSPIPIVDRSKFLRLSAFPDLSSGFFERNRSKVTKLGATTPTLLETGVDYTLDMQFTSSSCRVLLNGEMIGEIKAGNLDRGFLSIMNGWNPLLVSSLLIRAERVKEGSLGPFEVSGLLDYARLKLG